MEVRECRDIIVEELNKKYNLPEAEIERIKLEIEMALRSYHDIQVTITDKPHDYIDSITKKKYDQTLYFSNIIGNYINDRTPDFSIVDMQILFKRGRHKYPENIFNKDENEVILYLPEENYIQEMEEAGIKTFRDLLQKEEQERIQRIKEEQEKKKQEIPEKILEELKKAYKLSNEDIEEYKERITASLQEWYKNLYRSKIELKITNDPHIYDQGINRNNFVKSVIGDTIESRQKVNFSLGNIQICTVIELEYDESNEFIGQHLDVLVYIPDERFRQEETQDTYQQLLERERIEKVKSQIQQDIEEKINTVLEAIGSSYNLSTDTINEYIRKITEGLYVDSDLIDTILEFGWNDKIDNVKLAVTKDPIKYGKSIEESILYSKSISSVIGDTIIGREVVDVKKILPDFSLGDIQICINVSDHRERKRERELIVYIPLEKYKEEKSEEPKTYQELLSREKAKIEAEAEKVAEPYISELVELLSKENLTPEQINIIIEKLAIKIKKNVIVKIENESIYGDCHIDCGYGVDVAKTPDEFANSITEEEDKAFVGEPILGNYVCGEYRDVDGRMVTLRLPNFSLSEVQVATENLSQKLVIYIPEKQYEVENYHGLVKQRFAEKLVQETQGKLSIEDIWNIINQIDVHDLKDIELEVITDPSEYGEKSLKSEYIKIRNIFGDLKPGKKYNFDHYDYERKQFYDYETETYRDKLEETISNFSIGMPQVLEEKNEYKPYKKPRIKLKVYIPEKQYEEKDYEELVENKRINDVSESLVKQSNGNLSIEQAKEIAAKIEAGVEIITTRNPYEYGSLLSEVTQTVEQVNKVDRIEGSVVVKQHFANFTLNEIQVCKIPGLIKDEYEDGEVFYRRPYYEYYGEKEVPPQYIIYLPDEGYLEGDTFSELIGLDGKLETLRKISREYDRMAFRKDYDIG